MNAPMPASAHCPSEICPQKPVTSTIESRTMPKINEVVIASTHFCESTNSSAAVAAVTPTMTPGRSRPVPSAGRRSNTYPRIGNAVPLIMRKITITKKGADTLIPSAAPLSQLTSVR